VAELVVEGLGVLAQEAVAGASLVARNAAGRPQQVEMKDETTSRSSYASSNVDGPSGTTSHHHSSPPPSSSSSSAAARSNNRGWPPPSRADAALAFVAPWPPPPQAGTRRADAEATAAEGAALACRVRRRLACGAGSRDGVRCGKRPWSAVRLDGDFGAGDDASTTRRDAFFPVWLPKPSPDTSAGAAPFSRGPALALRIVRFDDVHQEDEGKLGQDGDDEEAWLSQDEGEMHRQQQAKAMNSRTFAASERGVVTEAVSFEPLHLSSSPSSLSEPQLPPRVLPLHRLTRAEAPQESACLLTLAFSSPSTSSSSSSSSHPSSSSSSSANDGSRAQARPEEVLSVVCASPVDALCAAASLRLLAALPPPLPLPLSSTAPSTNLNSAGAPAPGLEEEQPTISTTTATTMIDTPLAPLLAARRLSLLAPVLASRLDVRTVGQLARTTPHTLANQACLKPCHRRKCALLLAAHAASSAEQHAAASEEQSWAVASAGNSSSKSGKSIGARGSGCSKSAALERGWAAQDAFRNWLTELRAATAALKVALAKHPSWLLVDAPVVA